MSRRGGTDLEGAAEILNENASFIKWSGAALCLAGVLTFGINVVLTPMLPRGSFPELAASQIFLIRQSIAALAALLLLFGAVGLHISRFGRAGALGAAAFVVTLAGSAGLFSVEWNQLFTVRDFAHNAPDALSRIEDAKGLTPFDLGSLIAASAFFLGWLLTGISLLLSRDAPKMGGSLLLAGFIMAPVLSAAGISGAWAAAMASAVIGAGWVLIGGQMFRAGRQGPA